MLGSAHPGPDGSSEGLKPWNKGDIFLFDCLFHQSFLASALNPEALDKVFTEVLCILFTVLIR